MRYEIAFKLGQVNKCLDYELSPAHASALGVGTWDAQIKHLYGLRDMLLQELKAYRR